jgi:hypothetical protein
MIADIIVLLLVAALVVGALGYIRKQKQQGVTCIGCPHAGQCAKKRQGGCGTDVK